MLKEVRARLELNPQDFLDVGLTRDEFAYWESLEATEKVLRLVDYQRKVLAEQLAQGATLGLNANEDTARTVGIIAGLDFLLTMEYEDDEVTDERGEDESDTTENDSD